MAFRTVFAPPTADFDPGPSTSNLTSAGGSDFFVVKLVQPIVLAATPTASQPSNLLLTAAPTRRLRYAAVDSALADLGKRKDGAAEQDDLLDRELLTDLAFARLN